MANAGEKVDERRAYRSFILSISAAILLSFLAVFLGMAIRNNDLIRETLLARARSLFQEIVLTRAWNAAYGGVYVLKGPGIESNPWLVQPDLEAAGGLTLTKRNPALMTREISAIASKEADFRFKITSLRPLNPGNAPDRFERSALEAFETGSTETWEEGEAEFRYMGVLKVEEACLQCHAVQGYAVGEVRGGISVSFDIAKLAATQRLNNLSIAGIGSAVSAGLLGIVIGFFRSLHRKLDRAREELREAAVRDGLTGLHNRRHAMGRFVEELAMAKRTKAPLSCALVDADDFKKVNDELGHLAGDAVLKALAAAMSEAKRCYDLLGRFGGEEFLLVFPSASGKDALAACERIRTAVEAKVPCASGYPELRVTISIGVAEALPEEESADAIIARADRALYRAKTEGKNRCAVYGGDGP